MSIEDEGTPAGGGEHAGKPKGKGGPLSGKRRDTIIVACSVVGVVLAFLTLRRSSGQSATGGSTGHLAPTGAAQAGLGNAGAVAGFDASAYQGLQTLLANQSDQLGTLESAVGNLTGAGSKPPTAIASTLNSPTFNGNYFHAGSGIGEIEADKSLFVFSPQQWAAAIQADPNAPSQVTDLGNGSGLTFYSTAGNVKAAAQQPTVTAQ